MKNPFAKVTFIQFASVALFIFFPVILFWIIFGARLTTNFDDWRVFVEFMNNGITPLASVISMVLLYRLTILLNHRDKVWQEDQELLKSRRNAFDKLNDIHLEINSIESRYVKSVIQASNTNTPVVEYVRDLIDETVAMILESSDFHRSFEMRYGHVFDLSKVELELSNLLNSVEVCNQNLLNFKSKLEYVSDYMTLDSSVTVEINDKDKFRSSMSTIKSIGLYVDASQTFITSLIPQLQSV